MIVRQVKPSTKVAAVPFLATSEDFHMAMDSVSLADCLDETYERVDDGPCRAT